MMYAGMIEAKKIYAEPPTVGDRFSELCFEDSEGNTIRLHVTMAQARKLAKKLAMIADDFKAGFRKKKGKR